MTWLGWLFLFAVFLIVGVVCYATRSVLTTTVATYLVGFVFFLGFHLIFLQMVTPPLALLRASVWPIFWASGGRWPHGTPLPMD